MLKHFRRKLFVNGAGSMILWHNYAHLLLRLLSPDLPPSPLSLSLFVFSLSLYICPMSFLVLLHSPPTSSPTPSAAGSDPMLQGTVLQIGSAPRRGYQRTRVSHLLRTSAHAEGKEQFTVVLTHHTTDPKTFAIHCYNTCFLADFLILLQLENGSENPEYVRFSENYKT